MVLHLVKPTQGLKSDIKGGILSTSMSNVSMSASCSIMYALVKEGVK